MMRLLIYYVLLGGLLLSSCKENEANDEKVAGPKESKINCKEEIFETEGSDDPTIHKNCYFKGYKFKSVAEADQKGRYSYSYELYQKNDKGKYLKVKNSAFFNESQNELEVKINKLIKINFENALSDADGCLDNVKLNYYPINEMGITVVEDDINFTVTYGLSSACMAFDGTTISFKLFELDKYFK